MKLVLAACVAFLAGCQEKEEAPVDYSAIAYKFLKPVSFADDASENPDISSLKRRLDYRYAVMLGDTLDVTVLEFESDVYALDYYMNSGHFQGSVPILRGNFLEQSFRADKHIFIFRHDSYRRYERADLENYVRKFPGYHGGFPQAFLSLPFEFREQGRSSIQTKFFLGVKSSFPVLVQSYRDGNLRWNVARSWDQVESDAFAAAALASAYWKLCAERASEATQGRGIGSFRAELMNAAEQIDAKALEARGNIRTISG